MTNSRFAVVIVIPVIHPFHPLKAQVSINKPRPLFHLFKRQKPDGKETGYSNDERNCDDVFVDPMVEIVFYFATYFWSQSCRGQSGKRYVPKLLNVIWPC